MKIVIDGRMYNESGIGRYLRNLISKLQEFERENNYYILHLKKDYEKIIYRKNFQKVLADFKWYTISEQIKLPKILNNIKPDLVHIPHFNTPIFWNGKFVVTIHDLIHQHFSMDRSTAHGPLIYKFKNIGYKRVFNHAIKKSMKILTPSQFVKKQMKREWGIEGSKIVVTPEAVDDKFDAIALKMNQEEVEEILGKLKIKNPYLFYVGNAHPHKNIDGLIKAFLKLKDKQKNLHLVLSGQDNFFWKKIKSKFQDKNIIYTGFVSDEELVVLYKNAAVYVEPSFEEGFGIPILEAFACGCPVVSSNAGSLKEVGGEAAIYFNPNDIGDMVNKILKVLGNGNLRKTLVEKGKKRVKLFNWKKMAEQTLEVYNSALMI